MDIQYPERNLSLCYKYRQFVIVNHLFLKALLRQIDKA